MGTLADAQEGRLPCDLPAADIHRLTSAARPGFGLAASIRHRHRSAETRHHERHGHQRIMLTAPMRRSSSGSPGKLAAVGGWRPMPSVTLYLHQETSKEFPESAQREP